MSSARFFPSRRIALYMARTFLVRSMAVLFALVLILATLDLLGNSGEILAYPGNGDAEIWRYVGYRVPQLIARFLPFAVLLGTLITLAAMNQNSEIIAMKAAGISAHQIIAPLILASTLLAAANFVINERIVVRANAALNAWEDADYGPVAPETGIKTNIWVPHQDDLILARRVLPRGSQEVLLANVTVYQRDGGTLTGLIEAPRGRVANHQLVLDETRQFNVETGAVARAGTLTVPGHVDAEQFTLANVDPNEQDYWALGRSIEELNATNRETRALEANRWHKISGPLSTLLMPLLAAVAAFGLARSGQLFLRAVIGMVLGFAYFVADNFALAMGNLGAYPPLLAAWGPFLLFLLIGETVLIRTEE